MDAQCFPLAIQVPVPTTHWDGGLAVDLPVPTGTLWEAVFEGEAISYWNALAGNSLKLTAPDGTVAYYAHGNVPGVSGHVRAGQVIGQVGSTGSRSTGPHLHLAVGRFIDANGWGTIRPSDWLAGIGVCGPPVPPPPVKPVPVLALLGSGFLAAGLIMALSR